MASVSTGRSGGHQVTAEVKRQTSEVNVTFVTEP
jgi:hypothetical protein